MSARDVRRALILPLAGVLGGAVLAQVVSTSDVVVGLAALFGLIAGAWLAGRLTAGIAAPIQ